MLRFRQNYFFLALSGLIGFSQTVTAQECYRAEECVGALICMDQHCVASLSPLSTCAGDDACDWNEVCHDGYCKLEGVTCTNDWGFCYAGDGYGGCECGGSGFSDSGYNDPLNPPPPKSDFELYDDCQVWLNNECLAPPDPAEYCTAEAQSACTAWATKHAVIENNCTTDNAPENASNSGSGSVGSDAVDREGAGTAPFVDRQNLPELAAQEQVSLSKVVACCEELAELEEEGASADLALMNAFFVCVADLDDTDCDGYEWCEEVLSVGDEDATENNGADLDDDDSNLDSDESGLTDGQGDESPTVDGDNSVTNDVTSDDNGAANGPLMIPGTTTAPGSDVDTGDTNEETGTNEKDAKKSSKCSMAPGSHKGGVIALLKALF